MIRIILSVIYNAATWFQFLDRAWSQTEGQIDKMQDAAFDTPGAAPPVPPAILVAGAGVLAGHFALSKILRLRPWQSVLSLALGIAAGAALVLLRPRPSH